MIRMMTMLVLCAATPAVAQTQAQMNDRARADWSTADAAMTAQWRKTYGYMKGMDARDTSRGGGFGFAAAALASQRAWIAFRDRQCTIEAGEFSGGSMAPMARAGCLARLTRERTKQLAGLMWKRP